MQIESKTEIKLHDRRFEPFISEEEIDSAVQKIADQLNAEYETRSVVVIGVLKGAFVFLNALVQKLNISTTIEFVRVSSYDGMSTLGKVKMSLDFPESIAGQHVILVEDIIDTGITAQYLVEHCQNFNPASVKMVSLLIKPDCVASETQVDYVGMAIPDKFVVGYGMDYNEKGRELSCVYKVCE